MAIRNKMKANAAPYLRPGETVQAVFGAQTTSQYFVLISFWIIILSNAYRVIVVTDSRILVCQAGRFRTSAVKKVLWEFPRDTRLGPAHGLWYHLKALGEPVYVNRRFHKDIKAADNPLAVG